MFLNMFLSRPRMACSPYHCINDRKYLSIDLSPKILTMGILTALKSSFEYSRKNVLQWTTPIKEAASLL